MFGETIDYHILSLISHNRNIKTEEEIESEINSYTHNFSYEDFNKFITRSGKYFDWKGKRILDVCCGRGDLANALAKNGAKEVWGVDIQNKNIEIAKQVADKEEIEHVNFIEGDFHKINIDKKFDYIISYEAFDHIKDLNGVLNKMSDMVKTGGAMIHFSGQFWGGPMADHCDDFMNIFIPWRHLIFNEKALFKIRKEKYRPTDPGTNFETIRGGLSKYRFTNYEKALKKLLGFQIINFECNYQLKYVFNGLLYPLYFLSALTSRLPVLKETFIFSTMVVMKKT